MLQSMSEIEHCHICLSLDIIGTCEKCEGDFCPECVALYSQFSQIDYDCCCDCSDQDSRRKRSERRKLRLDFLTAHKQSTPGIV